MDDIERVARAICIHQGGCPDKLAFVGIPEHGPRNSIYVQPEDSFQAPRPLWRFYVGDAVAAIDALKKAQS
jgi:hypothetical protein